MTLLVCWVVFPILFGLIAVGCGLLVEWGAGIRLPGVLLAPLGTALVIVAAGLVTMEGATAELAVPLVVALAVAGYGLSFPLRGRRVDPWAAASAIAVFAVYGAPILLTGRATFAGYVTLDDTSTWLTLAGWVTEHGRTVSGLAPSSYELVLHDYLDGGTPVGSLLVLGIGGKLTAQDLAWLFQPTIAFFGAMLALAIYGATARLVRSRPLRAAVAFLGAQPALLVSYALWSGIKEVAAAFLIALACAVLAATLDSWTTVRATLPAAVAAAALMGVLSPAGAVWLVVPTVAVAVVLVRRDLRMSLRVGTALAVFVAVLSIPSIAIARTFLSGAAGNELTSSDGVANLGHPLDTLQIFGIWPASDFRTRPHDPEVTYVFIGVLIAAAVVGVLLAWRRRAWGIPLYVIAAGVGALVVLGLERVGLSSPWLNAKAMAEASPAIVAAAVAGLAALFEGGRRVEAAVAFAAIAGGVLWSNSLAYSNAWLAPRGQLAELEAIGERFAGGGPTLMTEYQPYGVRHFLRDMDPEAASERRRRTVDLRRGGVLEPGDYGDLDDFTRDAVLTYRTLVLRRSPVASRPPSAYELASTGDWYEVWQRPEEPPSIVEHLSLGSADDPAAVPACDDVLRVAGQARQAGGRLAAVVRPVAPVTLDLTKASYPARWNPDTSAPGTLVPHGGGAVSADARLDRPGRYDIWLGGSFRRTVTAVVDGQEVGSVTHQINNDGQWTLLGSARLAAGTHRVVLTYGGSRLAPGRGGLPLGMGPLVLSTTTADLPYRTLRPADAPSLCGKRLDWLEALDD